MIVSIIITTKDRKNELARALRSAIGQTIRSEIIVLDDGSIDGTSEMIRSLFPSVRLITSATSIGLVAQRNRGALLSCGEVIISIDDDAEFADCRVVEGALSQFSDCRVAAVAIPFIEPHKGPEEFQRAPNAESTWITDTFRGTSYAVRRDVFLDLGGFREEIIHQGEERDFCIRLLEQGFVVRLGSGSRVVHYEKPKRDWRRMDFYGRRNDILFAWWNVPALYLPIHLLGTTLRGLFWCLRSKHPLSNFHGIVAGYLEIIRGTGNTSRVSVQTYKLHRMLKRRDGVLYQEIERLLLPMRFDRSKG